MKSQALLSFAVTAAAASAAAGEAPWTAALPSPDGFINPIFMLRHEPHALSRFEEIVAEVSSPDHPRYGKYLSASQVKALLPPQKGAQESVLAFLSENNISSGMLSVSLSGDMISARIPVTTAQEMFRTEFREYKHPSLGRSLIRASRDYSLPSAVQEAVYAVGNLGGLPHVQQVIEVPRVSGDELTGSGFGGDCSGCSGRVTPGVLAEAYKFSIEQIESAQGDMSDTGMATAEFQNQYYDESSLDKFHASCDLPFDVKVDTQIGDNKPGHCLGGDCTEALLDIEYIKATSGGINLTNIFTAEYSYLDWAKQVDDLGDAVPAVHSISYGDDEIQQDERAPSGMTPDGYMFAINAQFAKLAAKGVSILVASGDQGVCGRSGCRSVFHPTFPASSPYVTTVGGTDFVDGIGEEQAWRSSGGGFSNTFARPKWQTQAVERYLSSNASGAGLPPASAFNSSGRAFPDISALGGEKNPFCVAEKMFPGIEHMSGVAGTSASTPVMAALIARLNAARLAKGLPRMGLLNPWIYQHPEVFGDVVHGKNNHRGDEGFEAVQGWDPATGFGTPRFDAMLEAALQGASAEVLV